jgi:hypothetical protein
MVVASNATRRADKLRREGGVVAFISRLQPLICLATEGAIGPRFLPSMWECAPYSALTATLKIRNVTTQKFAEEPCSYGPRAVRLPVPMRNILKATMAEREIAAIEGAPAKARAR